MYSEIYSILIGLVGLDESSYFGYIFAEFLAVFLLRFCASTFCLYVFIALEVY